MEKKRAPETMAAQVSSRERPAPTSKACLQRSVGRVRPQTSAATHERASLGRLPSRHASSRKMRSSQSTGAIEGGRQLKGLGHVSQPIAEPFRSGTILIPHMHRRTFSPDARLTEQVAGLSTLELDVIHNIRHSFTLLPSRSGRHWQKERIYGAPRLPSMDLRPRTAPSQAESRMEAADEDGPRCHAKSPFGRKRQFMADPVFYGSQVGFLDGD